MAHLIKCTKGATGGLTRHFERFKNEKGEYLKFGNQEINIDKIHLNYNLAEDKNQLEFIKKRTSEVKCLNRKDVNIMANWVITLPETIKSLDDQELFFKESYSFLEEKYGKENVISSFVHLDESTPHMHFAFVPVVYDKEKEEYKVSAKECITRNHLQRFHPELEAHMEKVFGYEIGILNEKTKEGNKTIEELKKETASKELNSLKENIKDKQVSLNTIQKDLNSLRKDLKVTKVSKVDIDKINRIQASEGFLSKGKITLDKKDYENLLEVAKTAIIDKEKLVHPFKVQLNKAIKENEGMKKEIDRLNEQLDKRESLTEKLKYSKEKSGFLNEIKTKDKKIDKLEEFIQDKDLVDEFNNMDKIQSKSYDLEL